MRSVSLIGTFNEWKNSEEWQLSQKSNGIWELPISVEKTRIPGNSGHPEFKFLINGSMTISPLAQTPGVYTFKDNYLIVFPEDDTEKITQNEKTALRLKTFEDFDLSNEDERKTIANFRLIPGTTRLFRSYNPCDSSKTNDAQTNRLSCVNEFIERNNIQSIISLSGNYVPSCKNLPTTYVQNIIASGHILILEPSYESVYYKSDSDEFSTQVRTIIEFINNPLQEGPFLIHCKIGTDRTGVMSALLAAICGASWENIYVDYQKSNDVGFEEYRDVKLLQYSIENMLKTKVTADLNLKKAVSDYFITNGYVSTEDISTLQAKL